jgi:hypothetical protein
MYRTHETGTSYHFVGDVDGFAKDGAEANSREDVHVATMVSTQQN